MQLAATLASPAAGRLSAPGSRRCQDVGGDLTQQLVAKPPAVGAPSLALVGHMPFLGRLASLLVVGDEQAQVVGFQMGGLVKLEPKVDRDGFSVAWALPPDLA